MAKPKKQIVQQEQPKEVKYTILPIDNQYGFYKSFWKVNPNSEQEFIELMTKAGYTTVRIGCY